MEKDDEIKGEGNSYFTEWRNYDSRIGRWLSLEPKPVAWESPFAFSRNNPILFNDPNGDCPDGNCGDVHYVHADGIAKTAIGLYGNNIIGSTHNKDVTNKVYNYIASNVAKKFGINVDDIPNNIAAHTFLVLTVQMAVDRAYSQITNPKQFEKYDLAISEENSIAGKADLIIDRYISNYQNQQAWDFTLLILESAVAAEGAASSGQVSRRSYKDLAKATRNRLTNGLQKAAQKRLFTISKSIDDMISGEISTIKSFDPEAIVGYRGSLATGTKFKSGKPFNPADFDVDAFIVSDKLSNLFKKATKFRDGNNIKGLAKVSSKIEKELQKAFPGYRTEPGKPFTFRVFTKAEFEKIVKPNGYKTF